MLSGTQKIFLNYRVADGGINKEKFRMMEGRRLAAAIDGWLRAFMQANTLNHFAATDAAGYQSIVKDIAEYVGGTNRASASFSSAVALLKKPVLRPGTGPIKGQHGRVTLDVINEVTGGGTQITRQTISHAVNQKAAKFGEDGLKVLKGNGTYKAELKIKKMGNERIVAATQTGGVYLFDKVVNKNEI